MSRTARPSYGQDQVVSPGRGTHPPLGRVVQVRGQPCGLHGRKQQRAVPLRGAERCHQLTARVRFRGEQPGPGVRAVVDGRGLGPHEDRSQHDPAVDERAVHVEVVTGQLPAQAPPRWAARIP
jgi:hypothetical protein